jgi:tetratricopeptide (TPR) repeat protein
MIAPKQILIVALLLLATGACFAQPTKSTPPEKKNSKLREYRSRTSNSSGKLLDDASKEAETNPAAALDKVEDALAESIAKDNTLDEAKSYLLIGDINARIPEWKLALQNYEKAYTILKTYDPASREFQNALTGLAKANMEVENYQASVANYKELLDLPIAPDERRSAQLGLAEVQYRIGNYDESLKLAQNIPAASSPRERDADPSLYAQQQNMLAKNYVKKNDIPNTTRALDSSRSSLRSAGATGGAGLADLQSTNEKVAEALRDQGRYDDEIAVRNQAVEFNLNTKDFAAATKEKVEIGKSLEAKGERSEALRELIEAATIADTIDNPEQQANVYLSLANLYEKNGQSNNALGAYRKYSQAVKRSEEVSTDVKERRSLLITKQGEIEELTKELYIDRSEDSAQKALIARQRAIIVSLVIIVLIIGVTSVFIYRSAQSSKRANQLLALKSLRSQMNPHFIFNALNSVNHFIAQQDERTANKFLSEFSQLMRLVLEYSQEDFITLQKEQEILALYMKLEHYRFRDKFNYEIEIDESINAESILVPPMLIQPYLDF